MLDHALKLELMNHSVGRGITNIPSSGAGLNGNIKYHLNEPRMKRSGMDNEGQDYGQKIRESLREKILNV